MNRQDYYEMPALNWSQMKALHTNCPAVFKWNIENPQPPTPAMNAGTALHYLCLEPDEFDKHVAVGGPLNSKGVEYGPTSQKYKNWAEEQLPRIAITTAQRETCTMQEQALRDDPRARELMWDSPGRNELVLEGEIEGVKCKGLADRVIEAFEGNILVDLKTTSVPLDPPSLDREIANRLYHGQMGLYAELARQTGICIDAVMLVFSPSKEPFFPSIWKMNRPTLDYGLETVVKCVKIYRECDKAGVWPGYSSVKLEERGLPMWAMPQEG